MRRIIVKLNDIRRELMFLNDHAKSNLMDLSKSDKRKIWFKLYAGKIATSSLMMLVGLVNALSAGLSITLSGGNWDRGTVPSGSEAATGSKWTVSGADDGREDIDIRVSNANSWIPDPHGNAHYTNHFALRVNDSGGTNITGSDARLTSSLGRNSSFSFGLWFKTPPAGSQAGAHTLTVTLTAKNFVPWCSGGYNYGGWCWRPSPTHGCDTWGSCNFICSNYHGKGHCDYSGIAHYMYTHHGCACTIVAHYANHHHCYFHYGSHCHQAIAYCYHWNNWGITYSRTSHEHCDAGTGGYNCWSRRMCSCSE